MFGLKTKRKPHKNSLEAFKKKKQHITVSQYRVLRAIDLIGPCNYREVAQKLRTIDGSVTNRISELKRKGMIITAFSKKRLNGGTVSYYKITYKGKRKLMGYDVF